MPVNHTLMWAVNHLGSLGMAGTAALVQTSRSMAEPLPEACRSARGSDRWPAGRKAAKLSGCVSLCRAARPGAAVLHPWPAAPEPAQAQPVGQAGSRDQVMVSHGSGSLVLLSDEDEEVAAAPVDAPDAASWDVGGPITDTQVREMLEIADQNALSFGQASVALSSIHGFFTPSVLGGDAACRRATYV